MATDLRALIRALHTPSPLHIVGHDIGGMIAHAYASRYASEVRSVTWGECPLPGTKAFVRCTNNLRASADRFHFALHANIDLAISLIGGREGTYLTHFFDKQCVNSSAITARDVEVYVRAYERPGALRAACGTYAALPQDEEDNLAWVREHGKCAVPLLMMNAELFDHVQDGEGMAGEMYEDWESVVIGGSGHFIAEEEPERFVGAILDFIGRKTGTSYSEKGFAHAGGPGVDG